MSHALRSSASAPRQLFGTTRAQRVATARQQFFEEGIRPSGLVGEPVLQSWMRCQRAHADRCHPVAFDAVTPSRLHATLGRNRDLLEAARPDLQAMESALGGTDCRAILIDHEGVVLHVTHHPTAANQPVMRQTARVGVNIAEHMVGTTAPGIVARTGVACSVSGAEHYFDALREMHCAAAPIRDVHGRLAAVLDLSVEGRHFDFDAAAMVGLYATTIENRLLESQSSEYLVLRFQANPSLIGTPLEGLAGIDANGSLVWLNEVGMRLIGPLPRDAADRRVSTVLGHELPSLLRLSRRDTPVFMRLGTGLGVWMRARLKAANGVDFRHAAAMPPEPSTSSTATIAASVSEEAVYNQAIAFDDPAAGAAEAAADETLRAHSLRLVTQTLAAQDGNVSRAARQLGISRGALYRRLREAQSLAPEDPSAPSA